MAGSILPDPFGFPETHWSLVQAAPHSRSARDRLFTIYYQPVTAFFRALTRDPHSAEELCQSFFTAELERLGASAPRGVVRRVDPKKGRFRDFLKQSLRHHWLTAHRRTRARPNEVELPADGDWGPALMGAEQAFLQGWARQIIKAALLATEALCMVNGKEEHFRLLTANFFPPTGTEPSWEDIARAFGLKDGKTARSRAATAMSYFRKEMTALLLEGGPVERLTEELGELLAIFGEDDDRSY